MPEEERDKNVSALAPVLLFSGEENQEKAYSVYEAKLGLIFVALPFEYSLFMIPFFHLCSSPRVSQSARDVAVSISTAYVRS